MLTLSFSHPAMDGIVQWGFWAGRHWRPDSAPWAGELEPRPIGQVYRDLVFGEWWTDATVKTGADGTVVVRGFMGDYEVTATHAGRTVTTETTLGDDGAAVRLELK